MITFIHYFLHLVFPGIIAFTFFKTYWKKVWIIMIGTMLVDFDHVWANPIFDPNRCSIGFHTFHTWPFIIFYLVLCFFPKTRVIGIGLSLHMLTDALDCSFM